MHSSRTQQGLEIQMKKGNIWQNGERKGTQTMDQKKSDGGTLPEGECATGGLEGRARGRMTGSGGNISVFVLSRRRARPNTFPTERMSVSVSRLEAGRPSCDSMWLVGASRSTLGTHSHLLSEKRRGGCRPQSGLQPGMQRHTAPSLPLWVKQLNFLFNVSSVQRETPLRHRSANGDVTQRRTTLTAVH